ncbi:MAG: Trm112 family protein [Candidatus Eisenbacteria bacterium]|nr:Trm112 family protein [Candidatus Eisenbacteria bacterium]
MLSPELLQILVCPACKGELRYEADAQRLVCPACRLAYGIKDDIPNMLIEEAEKLSPSATAPPAGSEAPGDQAEDDA